MKFISNKYSPTSLNSLLIFQENIKNLSVEHFKKTKLSFQSDVVLYGRNNVSWDVLGNTVIFLSQYLITRGDYRHTFEFITDKINCSTLEHFQKNKLLSNVQSLTFTGDISDELIQLSVKCAQFEKCLNSVDRKYFLAPTLDKETIQNIRLLTLRTAEYFRNKFQDYIPNSDDLIRNEKFLIIKNELIYLKANCKSLLNKLDVQQLCRFYLKGLEEQVEKFKRIKKLAIFIPSLNTEYSLELSNYL